MVAAVAQPRSVPFGETCGEALWQTSCAHERLRSCNVVRNTSPLHRAERTNPRAIIAAIPEDPARAHVAVARLTNGANVDQ